MVAEWMFWLFCGNARVVVGGGIASGGALLIKLFARGSGPLQVKCECIS